MKLISFRRPDGSASWGILKEAGVVDLGSLAPSLRDALWAMHSLPHVLQDHDDCDYYDCDCGCCGQSGRCRVRILWLVLLVQLASLLLWKNRLTNLKCDQRIQFV